MIRILAGEALVLAMLALVASDLGAHKRVENLGGLNIRGYRGPVAHQRQDNELRLVFAGSTRAFGWGEPPGSTIPASVRFELSRVLDVPHKPVMPIVAINLGTLGGDASSYADTLRHFAYLAPDYIAIVDDLGDKGPSRPFEPSGLYALTGYRPMLPLVIQEKGRVASTRLAGAPLEYAGYALGSLDSGLARLAGASDERAPLSPAAYAKAMADAVGVAHRQARGVVVVLAPVDTDAQRAARDALEPWVKQATAAAPWLRVVDLSDEAELYDPSLRLDGFSFGATATSIAAAAIAPTFLTLIPPR